MRASVCGCNEERRKSLPLPVTRATCFCVTIHRWLGAFWSGCEDGIVRIWDQAHGEQLPQARIHAKSVRGASRENGPTHRLPVPKTDPFGCGMWTNGTTSSACEGTTARCGASHSRADASDIIILGVSKTRYGSGMLPGVTHWPPSVAQTCGFYDRTLSGRATPGSAGGDGRFAFGCAMSGMERPKWLAAKALKVPTEDRVTRVRARRPRRPRAAAPGLTSPRPYEVIWDSARAGECCGRSQVQVRQGEAFRLYAMKTRSVAPGSNTSHRRRQPHSRPPDSTT